MSTKLVLKGMSNSTHTNVVGYYNQNEWPINVDVSILNQKIELEPGQYITDRNGKKINDPVFENYIYKGGLNKETSNDPVPYNLVPKSNQKREQHVNAVSTADNFRTVGKRAVPVYEKPQVAPTPRNESASSHMGMSIEKARELGLVRPTCIVPEDFGANEGDRNIPEIKYAVDSTKGSYHLTANKPVIPEGVTATKEGASIIKSLSSVGEDYDPEKIVVDKDAAALLKQANVNNVNIIESKEEEPQVEVVGDQKQTFYKQTVQPAQLPDVDLPDLDDVRALEQSMEESDNAPQVAQPVAQPVDEAKSETTEKKGHVCPVCGEGPFKYPSYLKRHIERAHPDTDAAAIVKDVKASQKA